MTAQLTNAVIAISNIVAVVVLMIVFVRYVM